MDCTITFSSDVIGNDLYSLEVNGETGYPTYWYMDRKGLTYSVSQYGYLIGLDALTVGQWSASGGFCYEAEIIKRTDKQLVLKEMYSDGINYTLHYLNSSSSDFSDNNGNGDSADIEKPEIGFYDFTATKTSLKIQYKIFNKSD